MYSRYSGLFGLVCGDVSSHTDTSSHLEGGGINFARRGARGGRERCPVPVRASTPVPAGQPHTALRGR